MTSNPDPAVLVLKNWQEVLAEVNKRIKKTRSEGESIWFRGQNEPWPVRSKLHRYILDLEKSAGKEGQVSRKELASLLLREFQTMFQVFGQKSVHLLPPIEQGPWGRVFSMQHYGIPTPLVDFSESFALAVYMANWNRDPNKDAAIYILEPLKMNAQSHVGPHQVALNDDSPGFVSRALTELYHPTLYSSVPEEIIAPEELKDRTQLPSLAVTPTAINGRMRAQKAAFVLSSPSFDPIDEASEDAILKIVLSASTYEDSIDWLNLVGFEHVEYFPDIWGVSVDFELRSGHAKRLAEEIAREADGNHSQDISNATRSDTEEGIRDS